MLETSPFQGPFRHGLVGAFQLFPRRNDRCGRSAFKLTEMAFGRTAHGFKVQVQQAFLELLPLLVVPLLVIRFALRDRPGRYGWRWPGGRSR